MYKVTNQQLYNDIRQGLDGVQISESSAEEMYSAIKDTLQDQEGFTEELIEKCASVAFDAVTDLYMESQGSQAQTQFSEDNIEELFAAEDQETYATWVGHGLNILKAGTKAVRNALRGRVSYAEHMKDSALGRQAVQRHGTGILGRMAGTYEAERRQFKKQDWKNKKEAQDIIKRKSDQVKAGPVKGFFKGFSDRNGFMGNKGGLSGMKDWAKHNKAQAATAGAVGAAAVGGAGYLAYRAYKKRKAAQAAQAGLNATHQVQPTK